MACAIGIETWRLASLIPVSGHWRWLGFNWYWRYSSGAADAIDILLVAVLLMLCTGWLGREMVYRRRLAIADDGS